MAPVVGTTYTFSLTATGSAGFGAIVILNVEVVEAEHHPYDANLNDTSERGEVVAATTDYFDEEISKDEVMDLVKLYFVG